MSNEDRKANALNRNTPDNTQIEWTEDICETAALKIFLLLSQSTQFPKDKTSTEELRVNILACHEYSC